MNFGNKDNPDSITAITDKTLAKAESGKETADTLIYKILPDGTAVIAAYLGKFQDLAPTVELNIPEQIEGHTVVAIGDNALRDGHAKIVGITLPSTIKEIGVDAIYAEELRYLRLNDGLETLKDGAIYCGTTLDTLVIPQSVRYIGYEAICGEALKISHSRTTSNIWVRTFSMTQLTQTTRPTGKTTFSITANIFLPAHFGNTKREKCKRTRRLSRTKII